MRRRNRWLLGLGLFALTLAIGLATRPPAQALSCAGVWAELELESVSVGGAPASTQPYQGTAAGPPTVMVWGHPAGVRLTVGTFQGAYEETYLAQPGR
jgi:hypothetical protein